MEEDKNQKELFEFAEPKKPFSKFTNMLPKRDFEGKIALSLTFEKIVFIFIGIVMVMTIVFAIGVENGRSRKMLKEIRSASPAAPIVAAKPHPLQSNSGVAPKAGPKAGPLQSDSGVAQAAIKPFTIVAATFSKKETAQAAVAFLAKEGFNASITYNDPYYRVCIGAYADMYGTQVQRDLIKVKRIYKDAFLRAR